MNQVQNFVNQKTMSSREIAEHLYVCHFSNGHIKVGRSSRPTLRIAAHVDRVSCLGVFLVAHHVVECVGDVLQAEAALIAWCRGLAVSVHKNEWFTGINFRSAVAEADKQAGAAYKKPTVDQHSAVDMEKHQKALAKFDELYLPKNREMEIHVTMAKLLGSLIIFNKSDIESDFKSNEKLYGLSRFELLTTIYLSTADSERTVEIFREAVVASFDADVRNYLLSKLSASAFSDAAAEGIKITTVERSDGTSKMCEQVLVTAKGLAKLAGFFGGAEMAAV